MKRDYSHYVILVLILLVAAVFRFYGIAWDSGYLFHPDERKIILVADGLRLPSNPLEFFSTESPLNPKFFAYGSFPIYLLKALSAFAPATDFVVPWRDSSFVGMALLGRALSAFFDLGTIVLTFLLARRLYDARVGLIASACIAVTVLHIQLAHFYAVDTLLTFFVVATVYCAARFAETRARRDLVLMSLSFGFALATKITAVPLIVPIVAGVIASEAKQSPLPHFPLAKGRAGVGLEIASLRSPLSLRPLLAMTRLILRDWLDQIWRARATLARIIAIAFAVFILTQPYALLDPIRFFGQVGTEMFVARGWLDFPYVRQYANTVPYLYQIWQSTLWGMGAPLGIVAWTGSALFVWQWWRTKDWRDGFILSWALIYFFSVGGQYAKYLRYLIPLLPFLYLMTAVALSRFTFHVPRLTSYASRITQYALRFTFYSAIVSAFIYSLTFVSIYAREHPWLQISRWIYENLPADSAVLVEHWDDLLPVPMRVADHARMPTDYRVTTLPMYDADDTTKLETLVNALSANDYIILASPRLYATIPRLPARYPISARYYRALFDGQLGFDVMMHALNAPALDGIVILDDPFTYAGLMNPIHSDALVLNWGYADESFAVYDHPLPLVFKKSHALSLDELRALLSSP